MKYSKKYLKSINEWLHRDSNHSFLSRHPEIEKFDMPKTFYFRYLPERRAIHWAIIVPMNDTYHSPVNIYFINDWGRIFDKLEFKSIKVARRRLRRNGFDFSTNRYCPFTPPEPIYIQLSCGKQSAPYSKGNLWQSVQRSKKHIDKIENAIIKQEVEYYERVQGRIFKEKTGMPAKENKTLVNKQIKTESKKNEISKSKISKMNNYCKAGLCGIAVIIGIIIVKLISKPVFWFALYRLLFGK